MLTWAEQMADATNAAVDPAAFGAVAPTYNGTQIHAVIVRRTDAWLSDAGSDITEYRYEALIPEPELSTPPAAGDVLIDGTKTYDTVAPAVLEFGLWRIPLRPILAEPMSFLTANGAYFVLADGRRLEVAA